MRTAASRSELMLPEVAPAAETENSTMNVLQLSFDTSVASKRPKIVTITVTVNDSSPRVNGDPNDAGPGPSFDSL
jgi:hypothetical protein